MRENSVPSADSVTPSSGAGLNQVFQFAYSDVDGFEDVQQVLALVTLLPPFKPLSHRVSAGHKRDRPE